jgi:hypothetical protein
MPKIQVKERIMKAARETAIYSTRITSDLS